MWDATNCFSDTTEACLVTDPDAASAIGAGAAYEECFGAGSAAGTADGTSITPTVARRVKMVNLTAGDRVLTSYSGAPAITRIITNFHKNVEHSEEPLVTLRTSSGSLSLTPDHVIPADGRTNFVAARHVKVGSVTYDASMNEVKVIGVEMGLKGRIINPWTVAGTILGADDKGGMPILATVYAPEWLGENMLIFGQVPCIGTRLVSYLMPDAFQAYTTALQRCWLGRFWHESVVEWTAGDGPLVPKMMMPIAFPIGVLLWDATCVISFLCYVAFTKMQLACQVAFPLGLAGIAYCRIARTK